MSRDRLASLYGSERRLAVPVMTHPGVDLIGKRVIDCVTDGAVNAAAVIAGARRYPVAATTMIMDLSLEAEAFGAQVTFGEDEVPTVTGRRVEDAAAIEALDVPGLEAGRVPRYLDAARRIREGLPDRVVLAGTIGPFSLAARLYGMTEIMTACYLEPDAILALLEKCTAFLTRYTTALLATGADGVVMAEPAAGLLSEDLCDAFSSPFVKRVVDRAQDDDHLFVLHNCGNKGHVTASMVSTGAGALHLGNNADMVAILKAVPPDRLVMGNVDPAGVMRMGTPETVTAVTSALLEATAGSPNFILSTGCDTPPGTPRANIEAFFAALDRFNAGRGDGRGQPG